MNKPHPDRQKALFHLNCAIQLNPHFTEAIEMRTQLSGHEATAVDNSTIRYFLKKQVLADRANGTTMPSVPFVVPIEPTSRDDKSATTKPALQAQADAAPTTQPVAEVPTTQPVAVVPTTQPSQEVKSPADDDKAKVVPTVVTDADLTPLVGDEDDNELDDSSDPALPGGPNED
jgi:hypothetical protein